MKQVLFVLPLLAILAGSAYADDAAATTGKQPEQHMPESVKAQIPLDQPNMDDAALLAWTAQAASDVMTFGPTDYQRRLQQSSKDFTKAGWERFAAALQRSRIIESVKSQNQTVSAQPKAAPVLVQKGPMDGKYRWIVTVPLAVTYKGERSRREDTLQLRLVIERINVLENPNAIGIAEWKAE